jgi:hypothetical protein
MNVQPTASERNEAAWRLMLLAVTYHAILLIRDPGNDQQEESYQTESERLKQQPAR